MAVAACGARKTVAWESHHVAPERDPKYSVGLARVLYAPFSVEEDAGAFLIGRERDHAELRALVQRSRVVLALARLKESLRPFSRDIRVAHDGERYRLASPLPVAVRRKAP